MQLLFEIEPWTIVPDFNQIGFGIQFDSPVINVKDSSWAKASLYNKMNKELYII